MVMKVGKVAEALKGVTQIQQITWWYQNITTYTKGNVRILQPHIVIRRNRRRLV